ncbi:Gag-Pol polyprotein, partial [Harpegnathos saltator]
IRPLQCFKCLEKGHVQTNCNNNVDRRQSCYRCGTEGHLARECTASARCVICADAGQSSGHRMGEPAC